MTPPTYFQGAQDPPIPHDLRRLWKTFTLSALELRKLVPNSISAQFSQFSFDIICAVIERYCTLKFHVFVHLTKIIAKQRTQEHQRFYSVSHMLKVVCETDKLVHPPHWRFWRSLFVGFYRYSYITINPPRAGSGVVTTDPLRFLVGCCKRQVNQVLSVLTLCIRFVQCVAIY